MSEQPPKELPKDYFAVRMSSGETQVFQRVDDPFSENSDGSKWQRVRTDTGLPWSTVDQLAADFDDDGDAWLYAKGITQTEGPDVAEEATEHEYKIEVESEHAGSREIVANKQSEAFSDTIKHLIKEYQLDEVLDQTGDMPYIPGRSKEIIRDASNSDSDWGRAILQESYYVAPSAPRNQKIDILRDLESRLDGVNIRLVKGWE